MITTHPPLFAAHAPAYYAKGMPVIPLHFMDKRAFTNDWSKYHDCLPDPATQDLWIKTYPHCNMGLVLGSQSRVVMLDIDTENQTYLDAIMSILPESPWKRVGRKGMALAYRYNGTPTFRIKDIAGATIVEHLSARTQLVLPPSIHPDTRLPYTANCELLDVVDHLPVLDQQIESLLRGALKEEGVELSLTGWTRTTDWTPAGARDVKMTAMAGFWAGGIVRGELPLIDAIERMKAWHAATVEKVAGDDIDIEKGIQNLVRFLLRDVHERNKILPRGWDDGLSQEQKEAMGLNFSDDHEEWDFEQLKLYLHDQFERYPDDTTGRIVAIEYVLKKIAFATKMTSLEEDRLLRYISEVGGAQITVTALRKRVRELGMGSLKGNDHTELAKAVIDDLTQVAEIRHHAGRFWQWNGSHWEELPEKPILSKIASDYGSFPAAKRFSDHKGIIATMGSLLSKDLVEQRIAGVNFANGVLMQNGTFKPHDPAYGFQYTLPFRYMPELQGKSAKFFDFLHQCWGRDPDYEQKLMALQEALCCTIFGMGPKLQRAILLYGVPKSGKSQLLTIAKSLVPDVARASVGPETWADKFAPTMMQGKLINSCGELSEKRPIDSQRFKSIIDGEEMTGQFKGGQLFQFRPVCTHWFGSNHLPRTDDSSSAFNRRWLILTFSRSVDQGVQRILDYGEHIVAEEREAIAAWAVAAGPRLLNASDFTLPSSHNEVVEEMASLNNSVRFFVRESGKVQVVALDGSKTGGHTSEKILHTKYYDFCLGAGGARPVGPRQFRQRMRELGVELGFKSGIFSSANGTPEFGYAGLILVDSRAK